MSLRIAFVHPVLGLGGAERLVVDAALEMQARGHRVVIFTAELDRERAFPATVDGSLEVRVHGDFIQVQIDFILVPSDVEIRQDRCALDRFVSEISDWHLVSVHGATGRHYYRYAKCQPSSVCPHVSLLCLYADAYAITSRNRQI